MGQNKIKYLDISFFVIIFVLSINFFKDYIFNSNTIISITFSSIIGLIISSGVAFILKNKKKIFKILFLIIYLLLIFIVSRSKQSNSDLFIGCWMVKEDNLKLELMVTDELMIMDFQPNDETLTFEYEYKNNRMEFIEKDNENNFEWEILKISSDSLIVSEDGEIFRFYRCHEVENMR